jgi:hypothetical protein
VPTAAAAPTLREVQVLSRTFSLAPSGPLASPQTVRLPLAGPVPSGWAVVVATAETSGGPWTYLPASLSADRRTVIFTTDHHSIFTVIGERLSSLLGFFKTEFLDGLSSGATAMASPPSCAGEKAARDGYSVQSSAGPTVYWCFGEDSSGNRVLRVVNNRQYPLEIWHPGLTVTEKPTIDYGSLASLSHVLSGRESILAPTTEIGYRVSLTPGIPAGVQTVADGFGQSLFALQTGINSLLAILTRFGAGSPSKAVTVMNKALGNEACAAAMLAGNPGSILSSCLSPKDMADYFGTAGVLLAPLAAAGGLAAFFDSEFQGLHDILTGRDRYAIYLHAAQDPTLGLSWGPSSKGYGTVQPSFVYNGGDPSGIVSGITWSSWGEPTATGTGIAEYVGPNQFVANGTREQAIIVASNLGTCGGAPAYTDLRWYFPSEGETFTHPAFHIDACTHQYLPL